MLTKDLETEFAKLIENYDSVRESMMKMSIIDDHNKPIVFLQIAKDNMLATVRSTLVKEMYENIQKEIYLETYYSLKKEYGIGEDSEK